MSDKLTDKEIIKALECCTRLGCSDAETKDCPLKPFEDCATILATKSLDLINRIQADYDRLERHTKIHDEIKAEAYKECIEKVGEITYKLRKLKEIMTGENDETSSM